MLSPKKRSGILSLNQLKMDQVVVSLFGIAQKQFLYSILWITAVVIFSYRYIDLPIARYFYTLKGSWIEHLFHAITMAGNSLPYIFISLFGYCFFRYFRSNEKKANGFMLVFLAVALSGIITDIMKWIMGRYRPQKYFDDSLYGFDFFHFKAAYTSFPSGHTTTAFALAMMLSFLFPRFQWVWWFFAIVIGVSRIILSQHYVSDVIFGAYIGVLSVMFILEKRKNLGILFVNT